MNIVIQKRPTFGCWTQELFIVKSSVPITVSGWLVEQKLWSRCNTWQWHTGRSLAFLLIVLKLCCPEGCFDCLASLWNAGLPLTFVQKGTDFVQLEWTTLKDGLVWLCYTEMFTLDELYKGSSGQKQFEVHPKTMKVFGNQPQQRVVMVSRTDCIFCFL